MLDLNHDQALRWNRGAGFGAVPEFIEALDIRRCKFAAAHVQKASIVTSHITVVALTRNAGVIVPMSVAVIGASQSRRARR